MTPSARDSRRAHAGLTPTVAMATKTAAWGPQKTQQANDVRRHPAEWSPFRWRWAGQGWMSNWWPKGREEGLLAMQVRPVPWGSGGPPALRSPSPSKEATRPPQDTVLYASAHTTPFAETLSALLTSLENASSPCKTHPGVSFSELYQERKVFVTGCLVHIRVLADPDCSSAGSATSLACQEAS